jgi:hypothetical protein
VLLEKGRLLPLKALLLRACIVPPAAAATAPGSTATTLLLGRGRGGAGANGLSQDSPFCEYVTDSCAPSPQAPAHHGGNPAVAARETRV